MRPGHCRPGPAARPGLPLAPPPAVREAPASHAAYLSPVPRPPHDPYTLILDGRLGWRGLPGYAGGVAPQSGAESATGGLALQPVPGSGRSLLEPWGGFAGLAQPHHLALAGDDCASLLLLLDTRGGRLRRFDPCACAFADLPCLRPGDPRLPPGTAAIAATRRLLYLADPPGRQVIVLDAATTAGRGLWRAPLAGPEPAHIPIPDWQPAALAASRRGGVWVGDRLGGNLLRLSPRGRVLELHPGFGAVLAIAEDRLGRLLILAEGPTLTLYDPASRTRLPNPEGPEALAGAFPKLPLTVYADGSVDLAPLCAAAGTGPRVFDRAGEPLAAPPAEPPLAYPRLGTWVTGPVDSGISDCVWDRMRLAAKLPAQTRLTIETLSAETELLAEQVEGGTDWRAAFSLAGDPGETSTGAATDLDFMPSAAPGRFLWLRLTLAGDGGATPVLGRISIDYPRIGLRRYLPAIFGQEPLAADFTDRLLAVFDQSFRSIEAEIDGQARLFDPRSAPAGGRQDFLGLLAQWVGVAGIDALPLPRRRELIRELPRAYAWRGTVWGLTRTLYVALGLSPWIGYRAPRAACVPCPTGIPERWRWRAPRLVLEHFWLRRWLWLGAGRLSEGARLWGERIVNRSRLGAGNPPAPVPGCPAPGLTGSQPGCVGPADARQADPGGGAETAQLGVTQLKTTQDPRRDPFHIYAHRLSIFVPAGRVRDPGAARALALLVKAELPGQVQVDLIPVEPRFRVGVQAMLGLDAAIGYQSAVTELGSMALGRGTVLGETGADGGKRTLRVGARRVGMDTLLDSGCTSEVDHD